MSAAAELRTLRAIVQLPQGTRWVVAINTDPDALAPGLTVFHAETDQAPADVATYLEILNTVKEALAPHIQAARDALLKEALDELGLLLAESTL